MQKNIDYWKRRQIREAFNVFSQAEIAADEIAKLYRKASAYMAAKMQGVYDKFKRKYGLTDEQAKPLPATVVPSMRRFRRFRTGRRLNRSQSSGRWLNPQHTPHGSGRCGSWNFPPGRS